MPYKIKYHHYCKQNGLCTETKYLNVNGNENFDFESVKETLSKWAYDAKRILDSVICHKNGDETWFRIEYNGKWCQKYRNGIKKNKYPT